MRFFLITFLITAYSLNAQQPDRQNLDSLYKVFLTLNGMFPEGHPDHPSDETEKMKCGFGITNEVKMNLEFFTPEEQLILKPLLNRPEKQSSLVSPSGFFRVHYDTSGTGGIPHYIPSLSIEENVLLVAAALDSSYKFQVDFLGYIPPPPDFNAGGDNKYDVYIQNLGGVYGYTSTDTAIGNQKYTSYIVIDNDYTGFYSTGEEGMQVTVAHEFYHAIQVGGYTGDKINIDLYLYELSATAMEEFVYNEVNDYYAYMPSYFNNTSVSLSNTNGYEIALWNIFLKDKFSYNILKRQWELLSENRALNAINISINDYNSNFKEAFHDFGVWNFFTNSRAKQGQYFEEAGNYPLVRSISSILFSPPDETIEVNSKAVVNSYITFINNNTIPRDTLIVLITNADYANGISNSTLNYPFEYKLFNYAAPGSIRLNENFNYHFIFDVNEPQVWSHSEFLNSELIGEHKFFAKYNYAFPSPFIYGKNTYIFIPVNNPGSGYIDLNIYSPSMDLVYISTNHLLEDEIDGQPGIKWNALNDGQRLASGVYIYAVKSGDKTTLGKLVIFNE